MHASLFLSHSLSPPLSIADAPHPSTPARGGPNVDSDIRRTWIRQPAGAPPPSVGLVKAHMAASSMASGFTQIRSARGQRPFQARFACLVGGSSGQGVPPSPLPFNSSSAQQGGGGGQVVRPSPLPFSSSSGRRGGGGGRVVPPSPLPFSSSSAG